MMFFFVGSGIGPETTAPVDFTVWIIFSADLSIRLWSYDFSLIRIFCCVATYYPNPFYLFQNFRHDTGSYRTAAFPNGESKTGLHSDRLNQIHIQIHIVSGHDHLHTVGQLALTSHVGCTEVELGTVAFEKWRMASTLILTQDIDFTLKGFVRCDSPRLAEYHTPLKLLLVDSAKQNTGVVTCLPLIQKSAEHLDTCNHALQRLLNDTDNLDLFVDLDHTTLDTPCSNSSTTGN